MAAASTTASTAALTFPRRILSHFDSLSLAPTDLAQVERKVVGRNIALVSYLLPASKLQQTVHARFEVEPVAQDADGNGYGLLTIVSSQIHVPPAERSLFERVFDPRGAVINQVTYKTSVIDRQYWHRTAWTFFSSCSSKQWAENPRKIYGIDIDLLNVNISVNDFDNEKQCYKKSSEKQSSSSSYMVDVPEDGLSLAIEDTGHGLLDQTGVRVTDGFIDNESALRVIGMHRESIMWGAEGALVRQGAWSTPVVPNVGRLDASKCRAGRAMTERFGLARSEFPIASPVAVWLVHEVPKTLIYEAESMIEDEHDQAGDYSSTGEQAMQDRVQRKAMNRHNRFRTELRGKVYDEK